MHKTLAHRLRLRPRPRALCLSIHCALAALALPALAQTAPSATLPEVTIKDSAVERDGATTGYKASTARQVGALGDVRLLDAPFSINVMTKELIENLQASKPDDVFRFNPVVQMSGPQSRFFTSLTMRGFGLGSTKRLDGVPSTTSYVNVDLEDKERIEVITGLSGFLHGTGNVGGTVNYVLKRPTYQPLAQVTVGNTDGGNLRVHGDFGGAVGKDGKFAWRANVVAQDGNTSVDTQSIRRGLVSGALDWNLTDNLQLQFDASRSSYHMRGTEPFWDADAAATYPQAPDTATYYGQPFTQTDTSQTQYGVRLNWKLGDAVSARAGLTRRDSSIDLTAANNIFVAGTPGNYRVQASAWDYPEVQALGGFALFDATASTGSVQHKFTFGWYGDRDERTPFLSPAGGWATLTSSPMNIAAPRYFAYTGGGPTGAKYIAQRSSYDNWVLGDQIQISPQWSALLGATRATITDTAYNAAGASTARYQDSRVTPSMALSYKPQAWMTLYTSRMESLEKGGTAPATSNGVAVVNAGEVLPPLLSQQLELGTKMQLGGMLLTGALFNIDKGLQYVDTTRPTTPRYVQDGRQVHKGLEFTASGRVAPRLLLWGGVTLLDATTTKQANNPALQGKTPANVAEVMAKLYAEFDLPGMPGLTLTGGVLHTGEQQRNTLNTEQLPAYTLLDAGLRYATQLAGKPLTLRLNVANLADKDYWLNSTYTGRPRTATLSAQMNF